MSDLVFLTSDNCRGESIEAIVKDMMEGISPEKVGSAFHTKFDSSKIFMTTLKFQMGKTVVQEDREEAIRLACSSALPGDFVLIAGKGHETHLISAGVKMAFNDKEVVQKWCSVSYESQFNT